MQVSYEIVSQVEHNLSKQKKIKQKNMNIKHVVDSSILYVLLE